MSRWWKHTETAEITPLSLPQRNSFSYLNCSQNFRVKCEAQKQEGTTEAGVKVTLHHSLILGNRPGWFVRPPARICLWSQGESVPHGNMRAAATSRQFQGNGLHSGVRRSLFNAGTSAACNKAAIAMFGVLWPAGTFLALPSYANSFLRLTGLSPQWRRNSCQPCDVQASSHQSWGLGAGGPGPCRPQTQVADFSGLDKVLVTQL